MRTRRCWSARHVRIAVLALCLGACSASDPVPTGDAGPRDARVNGRESGTLADAVSSCRASWALPTVTGQPGGCAKRAGDYTPGDAADGWPPCVSDDGAYHPFDPSISSAARVAAFEEIRSRLLGGDAPSRQAFVDARVAYSQPEGLLSRVARREDEHVAPAAKACADMTADELSASRDRCAGPAQILPLLTQAFAAGAQGTEPLTSAARVEAGLLWFLYLSVHKEALTCASNRKDCDSSQAYYHGGAPRSGGLGLARYVRDLSAQAHDRVWDGLLAVRCWRDLDPADKAEQLDLRGKAVGQLDRALLRGLALLVKARVQAAADAGCEAARAALWTSAQLVGRILEREARLRDAAQAEALRAELSRPRVEARAVSAVHGAVEALFPCP